MAQRSWNRRQALLGTAATALGSLSLQSFSGEDPPGTPARKPTRVLLFSGTGWYRHPEIPQCNGWLVRTLGAAGFEVDVTETPADLTKERLAGYDLFVMNNCNELTTLLTAQQRQAIEDWYKQGHGIVALHAALVHQTEWTWFYELAGCDFNSDSAFEKARVVIDPAAADHPAVVGQEPSFWYAADWTNHDKVVTGLPGVTVLLRVDESTYPPVRPYFQERGGKAMGKDHPIAWIREWGGGRFFYTEFGHDLRSINTAFGTQHITEGARWAGLSTRRDFAQFFMTEIKERGGRLQTTSSVAPIEAHWTIERDEFGFQVHLFDAEIAQVNTFMDQALGKPLIPTGKNLNGEHHTVYDAKISGFHVQVIGKKSEIYIVAVGPRKGAGSKDGATSQ